MISVCIPVFNYSVLNLVNKIHQQLTTCKIPFEIIVLDDASTNVEIKKNNQKLTKLSNVLYEELEINLGNRDIRSAIAQRATYDWLLFLDADTIPAKDSFIQKYINQINLNIDGVCGGIIYDKLDNRKHILRWKYGVKKETFSDLKNTKISEWKGANYLMKREIFLINERIPLPKKYGFEDALFGIQLKQKGYNLIFIDNPVFHNGLETADKFLQKFNQSIGNALFLTKNFPELTEEISLIKVFKKFNQLHLIKLVSLIFTFCEKYIIQNLTSENPNLTIFQFYKIGYMCKLASSKTDSRSPS